MVIVTDDQDYMLNSTHPAYMPELNALLVNRGLQLRNFLISTAACCPSRTILMTGRYTHNNNVTSNIPPHGEGRLCRYRPGVAPFVGAGGGSTPRCGTCATQGGAMHARAFDFLCLDPCSL